MSDEDIAPAGAAAKDQDDKSYLSVSSISLENPLEDELLPDDDDDEEGVDKSLTSNGAAMMHLLKGNIGTGILAMPNAILNAGLLVGTVGTLVIGTIAVHCMHMLLQSSRYLNVKLGTAEKLDYTEVVVLAFRHGPQKFRKYEKFMGVLVRVFLNITQFGFCCVYILFIGENMRLFVEHFKPPHDPSVIVYMVVVAAFLIPFSFLKNLKMLAPFSMFANILTVTGLIIVIAYCVQGLPPASKYPMVAPLKNIPLFFGTVIFAFEGISLVLPIENKMRTPSAFGGLSGVLNTGMVIVTCLYTAVGFFGYMQFGDKVKGSITLNMPTDFWLYLSVKVMFSIALFISYGLQFYVPIKLIWPLIAGRITNPNTVYWGEYLFRTICVIFTFALASVIPHLDLLISLIGAVSSSALALIFPPIIEILTYWPDNKLGRCKWIMIKDIFIVIFGLFGFAVGTVVSLLAIIDAFSKDKK